MAKCKPVNREYYYKHLTLAVLEEIEKDFELARKQDKNVFAATGDNRPINVWATVKKNHGILYSQILGLEFIPRYGTETQGRAIQIHVDDYLIFDQKETFLISEENFEYYFKAIK